MSRLYNVSMNRLVKHKSLGDPKEITVVAHTPFAAHTQINDRNNNRRK